MQCNTFRLFKCPPVSQDVKLVAVNPALKKHLSEKGDVAGMQRYFNAICFSKGNCSALWLHKPNVFASCGIFALR